MQPITVSLLLRIRVRRHFVMSHTKYHESHYVTVLDNPPLKGVENSSKRRQPWHFSKSFLPCTELWAMPSANSVSCPLVFWPVKTGESGFVSEAWEPRRIAAIVRWGWVACCPTLDSDPGPAQFRPYRRERLGTTYLTEPIEVGAFLFRSSLRQRSMACYSINVNIIRTPTILW